MSAYPPLRPDATYDRGFVLTQPYHSGKTSYNPSPHLALDMAGYLGQPVRAAEAGRVFASSWNGDGWAIGGGHVVMIDHASADGKKYRSLYAHLKSRTVSRGQYVARGQIIGYADSTGTSTGSHLHFAIGQYQGISTDGGYRYLDPFRFFLPITYENGARGAGDLADDFRASEYCGPNVNARAGASTSYAIVYTARSREMWGYLGSVQGQQPPGFSSRMWDRVWIPRAGRVAYVHSQLGEWVP